MQAAAIATHRESVNLAIRIGPKDSKKAEVGMAHQNANIVTENYIRIKVTIILMRLTTETLMPKGGNQNNLV